MQLWLILWITELYMFMIFHNSWFLHFNIFMCIISAIFTCLKGVYFNRIVNDMHLDGLIIMQKE